MLAFIRPPDWELERMWIFLWIVISAILLGATLWSLQILLRQKAAWEAYAKKKSLKFSKGTFMGPAEIQGMIGEYSIAFFTAERQEVDARRKRYITAVEIGIKESVIDGAVAGTQEMLLFMQGLGKLHRYKVEGWPEDHYLFVMNDAVAKAYFTDERLNVFADVLKTRNADVIVVIGPDELIIRVETTDPMQDAGKIDKVMTRLISLADKMRVTPEQNKALMALGKSPAA